MSEAENTQLSSNDTQPRMIDGEEPTELLLALASSPLLTLQGRGVAKLVSGVNQADGAPIVLAIIYNAVFDESVGISLLPTVVPTLTEPVEQ